MHESYNLKKSKFFLILFLLSINISDLLMHFKNLFSFHICPNIIVFPSFHLNP